MKIKSLKKVATGILVIAVFASALFAAVSALPSVSTDRNVNLAASSLSASSASATVPAEVERLKALIPVSFAEAEDCVVPVRGRFLLWTQNLEHIMWGRLGGRFFAGEDNLGKHAWGVYGNGYFAGFYDGNFFWGRYSRGSWKAVGLFNLNQVYGGYRVYPLPVITATGTVP